MFFLRKEFLGRKKEFVWYVFSMKRIIKKEGKYFMG